MSRTKLVIFALLPLVAFALGLLWVDHLFTAGEGLRGICWLIGMLALFALVEGIYLRRVLIPLWGEKVAERIYAGSYVPDEDPLVQLAERVRETRDEAQLAKLEKAVRAQGWRYRGWMELAAIQRDVFSNPAAACSTLQEGAAAVEDPQDAAMLLYRAAHVAEAAAHDAALAESLRRKAAADYPETVYGRKAAAELPAG
ncbi:MAG: hypothetical protein MJ058_08435 [Akkermansia sp.]|nr:hypothetical protein [Akkermansia sp.]